ncbi:superoxide dismutase [Thermus tengchongensis]|uniref:Superoxide dismutase n=1 Tax=Thermus tengchongensis TaxID=1214928 RepID=A0A4Y9FE56_9DEIN|nr:superoxide dismutase [Thermus tengchongensis]TFU27416.1 superoxide dismutase [Thermus tengchongensis]
MPYPFTLPELGYPYEALEPHIDAKTMEIHHQKHHGAYVANLNATLEKYPYLQGAEVETLLRHLAALPADIQTAVRNNGGGHLNHSLFWELLTPGGAQEPVGELKKAIEEQLGGFQALKERLTQAAMGRFGSGWAWLAKDPFGKLHVFSTANQDNPVMEGFTPIVGIDVWEHAYYLKYQNRRADYLQAVWNVINWDKAEEIYRRG